MINLDNFLKTIDKKHAPYIKQAYEYAMRNSEDKNTRVGAVLVRNDEILLYGTNHYIKGFNNLDNEKKYNYIIHAEADAILKAAKSGIATEGTTLYAPWFSCIECAKNIIGSGISKIVGHTPIMEKSHNKWEQNINTALEMLHKSGIELILYENNVNSRILFQGEILNV